MISLIFAYSWYFGILSQGGVCQRGSSNTNLTLKWGCGPRRDFAQQAKSRGSIIVARTYRKVLIVEIYSQYTRKIRFPRSGAEWNRWVMMTFHCSCPQVKDGQDDVKQKIPEGTAQVDFVTLIIQSYFDTLAGADLGGACRGCTPLPPEMTCGFLIQLVFCRKKTMWFIGFEVEQEKKKILDPPLSWVTCVSDILWSSCF